MNNPSEQERTPIQIAPTTTRRARGFFRVTLRMMRRNPNMALGVAIIIVIGIVAIFAPLLTRTDYTRVNARDRLQPPSTEHFFGTDPFGRDIYDRTIVGSRISLLVGFSVTFVTVIAGVGIALVSGYYQRVDNVLMRFVDGIQAFPAIILALALIALLGSSLQNVIIALAVTGTAGKVRLVRSQVLTLREQQYVEAAKAIGAPAWRILLLHIAPNTFGIVAVQATFTLAVSILSEATLSFLGAGVPSYIPSWGNIVSTGRGFVQVAFWISFFPGLFLTLTVLAVILVGDTLRDYLDPRLRGMFR